jgi:hypothetical protein
LARLRPCGLWLAVLVLLGLAPVAAAEDPPATTTEETPTEETTTETTTEETTLEEAPTPTVDEARLRRQIARQRSIARTLHRHMGKRRPRVHIDPAAYASRAERLVARRDAWRSRAQKARDRFRRPPHLEAWRCIHRHEGPWSDPYAPYYGGLQMDLTFQRMYGRHLLRRKGTADRWRPREQMWVAEGALRAGRGFYPWPVAARRCGLI